MSVAYLSNGSTTVNGETEDHLITGNSGSAVLVIHVQTLAIVAERLQVRLLNHNVHVV